MKDVNYYNKIYSERDKYRKHYTESKYYLLWKNLLKILQRNKIKTVLDIGCGSGQLGEMLRDNFINYAGFDYSEIAVNMAKKKKLKVWVGDVYNDKNYQKADAYLCMEVLEHLRYDRKIFSLLPRNGIFCFSVPMAKHESHVRRFKTEEKIRKRFSVLCFKLRIKQIDKRFLCKGIIP